MRPLTTPRKIVQFSTYDLEWYPNTRPLKLRMVGVYDQEGGYRYYRTVEEFIGSDVERSMGRTYYAHAGGLADFAFIVKPLKNAGWSLDITFSGSSAIIVRASNGWGQVRFCDSLWLLRGKLADIGKWIGKQKGSVAFDTDDFIELIRYNRQDCEILYEAIAALQNRLLEFGGEMKATLASCAMALFRRKYLTEAYTTPSWANEIARRSYISSRVEPFSNGTRILKSLNVYDINSSFPHAMTFPLPSRVIARGRGMTKHETWIADCDLEVPECYLPPLPWRHPKERRIYFPTGKWRAWVTSVDAKLLVSRGGRIHKVRDAIAYKTSTDMRAYAIELFELRRMSTEEFSRQFFKLLLNSLYGKTAESEDKVGVLINPPKINRERWTMYLPGIWRVPRRVTLDHVNVAIASFVTSIARRTLFYALEIARRTGQIYYCDTDSVVTSGILPTGDGLGQLKFEGKWEGGEFAAPKLYRLFASDGTEKVKAKGFSKLGWDEIRAAKPVNRMVRLKEMFQSGDLDPRDNLVTKHLRPNRPKRAPDGEEGTRPWTIRELTAA